MKALAYAEMVGEGMSPELEKLRRIDRFGMEAVTGRKVFFLHEIQRLIYAENVSHAYESRKRSANWAEWIQSNPRHAAILAEAERLYNDRPDQSPV